jgi:hypothetical protein
MLHSILYKIHLQLTPEEIRDLKKWLASTFFNQREDISLLFIYLVQNAEKPLFLTKEKVWKKINPKIAYNEAQMNRLMSLLLAQIKQYLTYSDWQKDETEVQLRLCRTLRAHHAPAEMLEKELENTAIFLENEPYRDAQHHFQNLQLQREKYEHTALLKRDTSLPLTLQNEALENSFLLQTLRQSCNMQNYRNILKNQTVTPLTQQLIANITEKHKEQPLVRLYYHLNFCLENPEAEDYFFKTSVDLQQYGH